jgi:signal transduction histidine kinase
MPMLPRYLSVPPAATAAPGSFLGRIAGRMGALAGIVSAFLGAGITRNPLRGKTWRRTRPSLRTLAASALCAASTIVFWRALVLHQDAQIRRVVDFNGADIAHDLHVHIESLAEAIEHLATLARDSDTAGAGWEAAARQLFIRPLGPEAIEWLDEGLTVRERLVAPRRTCAPLRAPTADPFDNQGEEVVIRSARPLDADPFEAGDNRPVLSLVAPVRSAGSRSVMAGIFDVRTLVGTLLARHRPEFSLRVSVGATELYRSFGSGADEGSRWRRSYEVKLPGGRRWTLEVGPSPHLLSAVNTPFPEMLLVSGLMVSVLVLVAMHRGNVAWSRSRVLARLNDALRIEMRERVEAQRKAEALARELENRVEARTAELARVNTELRAENARRQHAQAVLARSNEDLRHFASFVSHELRQPLASGQIYVDLLDSTGSGELRSQEATRYLSRLRASFSRMTSFVDSLRRLTRVAPGTSAAFEPVDLTALARDVARSFEPESTQARARVEVANLPVIDADKTQFRQVLFNLIENALKYRREDVPLVVRIDGGLGNAIAHGDHAVCEIRISDNGRGFDPAEAESVFQVFHRLSHGSARGSGLGLAICRRIIENHGGSIRAEAASGVGATFIITVPARHDHESSRPAPLPNP